MLLHGFFTWPIHDRFENVVILKRKQMAYMITDEYAAMQWLTMFNFDHNVILPVDNLRFIIWTRHMDATEWVIVNR